MLLFGVCFFLQELLHELRITNQTMYLHPPVEGARELLHQDMFAWEAVILQLPRIRHSRYQVRHSSSCVVLSCHVRNVFVVLKRWCKKAVRRRRPLTRLSCRNSIRTFSIRRTLLLKTSWRKCTATSRSDTQNNIDESVHLQQRLHRFNCLSIELVQVSVAVGSASGELVRSHGKQLAAMDARTATHQVSNFNNQ